MDLNLFLQSLYYNTVSTKSRIESNVQKSDIQFKMKITITIIIKYYTHEYFITTGKNVMLIDIVKSIWFLMYQKVYFSSFFVNSCSYSVRSIPFFYMAHMNSSITFAYYKIVFVNCRTIHNFIHVYFIQYYIQ